MEWVPGRCMGGDNVVGYISKDKHINMIENNQKWTHADTFNDSFNTHITTNSTHNTFSGNHSAFLSGVQVS